MLLKKLYYLISDVGISFTRRFTKRKSYICKFAFKSTHFFPTGFSSCCESAAAVSYDDISTVTDFYNSKQCSDLRKKVLRGDYSSCPAACHTRLYAETPPEGSYNASKSPGRIVVGHGRVFGEFRHLRDELLKPDSYDTFHMTGEDSCDLHCIMCRDKVMGNQLSKERVSNTWNELNRYLPKVRFIVLGGTGEPLIQKNSLDFLCNTTKETAPNMEQVCLITNGSHLTPDLWNKMSSYVKERLELRVSVDAATLDTYKNIRRGGDFEKLISHLQFIKDKKIGSITLSMCVQEANFREMLSFIDLSKSLNAHALFGQVNNHPSKACHLPGHKDHKEFLEVIKSDKFLEPHVIGNFIYPMREAIGCSNFSSFQK